MKCKKCNGEVVVDNVHHEEDEIELLCLICGYRAFVSMNENKFGQWLKTAYLRG
jgi:transcription elongation factor Elf1